MMLCTMVQDNRNSLQKELSNDIWIAYIVLTPVSGQLLNCFYGSSKRRALDHNHTPLAGSNASKS
mgnify:FL=1